MNELTFHFDRIPVETVKKIAHEFHSDPAQNSPGVSNRSRLQQVPPLESVAGENRPTQPQHWRDLAERASKESDPGKLIHLVQQLCETLESNAHQRKRLLELNQGPDAGKSPRS